MANTRYQERNTEEAAAIAVVLLVASFLTLVLINLLERWSKRFEPAEV